ncbi:hypothetical protein QBC46DRAFT_392620 [Diplogelasinospora grovesii]|uniref:Secreted protein n=1 Tax=Diplogelasinospora grovesii TaxID=303347 RepID=A0AAN6S1X5_9PEZI|nr:hypothetical protein QBC46DRAFT_392620 [Diplogelasinospora grovesii]
MGLMKGRTRRNKKIIWWMLMLMLMVRRMTVNSSKCCVFVGLRWFYTTVCSRTFPIFGRRSFYTYILRYGFWELYSCHLRVFYLLYQGLSLRGWLDMIRIITG